MVSLIQEIFNDALVVNIAQTHWQIALWRQALDYYRQLPIPHDQHSVGSCHFIYTTSHFWHSTFATCCVIIRIVYGIAQ